MTLCFTQSSSRWVGYSRGCLPCNLNRTLGSPSFARQEVLQTWVPTCSLQRSGAQDPLPGSPGLLFSPLVADPTPLESLE